MVNANVLSSRYTTQAINDIFSEKGKTIAERDLWIAVMKAQNDLGLDIPLEVISKYEAARENVDLARINEIEKRTKHDVKAKIEAFVEAAGTLEKIHQGMTSRDLTDNVEQMQIKSASKIIFGKYVAVLKRMLDKAQEYEPVILTARTHHQPAQPTLLGRRFAMWAEELCIHLYEFEHFIDTYPLRGIKGPVGTQFDMLTLLRSKQNVMTLERLVARELGFNSLLDSTGQVYPRSLDYALVSKLAALASACENFAKGMRLMAGYELVTEGFKEGQVGSSAMPHKMNTPHSERICGLAELLKMYADGASRICGDQWEEGDVSCSVVRRVIIPDSFYASDGLVETTLNVLGSMGTYPVVIEQEVDRYLPFLATTEMLMTALQHGIGRETAHQLIKKHAVEAALDLRKGIHPSLAEKLSQEEVFWAAGITKETLEAILSNKEHFIGTASDQIHSVRVRAWPLFDKYAAHASYTPQDML